MKKMNSNQTKKQSTKINGISMKMIQKCKMLNCCKSMLKCQAVSWTKKNKLKAMMMKVK